MNSFVLIITLLITLIFCSGCNRDGPLLTDVPTQEISTTLDKLIPKLMQERQVVGLSIAVLRDGKVSIEKSFGYSNLEKKIKTNEDTVYRAASLGKPIFAYIVITLAKQGKLDLDVPLYSYLNEEVVVGDLRSKSITARMVLNHTTGLPNLGRQVPDIKFIFEPGTEFKYSGHAYLYLQKVIEKITNKPLNTLANDMLFKPLKMTASSFVWEDRYQRVISSSYDNSGKAFPSKMKPVQAFSAWSLFTTMKDYNRFISHMIDTSNHLGAVAQTMLTPHVDVANGVKWGLGWGIQSTQPNYSFWHWGSMAGFRHYIVAYPKEKLAVIVLTNSWRSFQIVDDIMATAIGGSYPSYDWF